ncbi:class I SAM-dependent methyltransferase [Acidobacteria bacterium AH-259-D05]|nr:class I SAM-dependent methyltransferase [Acidobacteria bacterium AH-259-D05]
MLQSGPQTSSKYYNGEYRKCHGPRIDRPSSCAEIFESYVHYQGQRVQFLKPWLNSNARLLEVGCSTGHFLYNVKDLVAEVVGVDYDFEAAKFASKACNCTTFGCGLEESGLPPLSFDIVCAIQTMEHVEDPIAFLTMLGKYLRPEGTIYIEVPSLYDALLSVYNNLNYFNFYFHEPHLFYFSSRSLATVTKKAGFKGNVHFIQDYNFLNHLHWILVGKPQPTCHEGLASPELPINTNVSNQLRRQLNTLMETVDKEYKAILAQHGLTDNVAFVGQLSSP